MTLDHSTIYCLFHPSFKPLIVLQLRLIKMFFIDYDHVVMTSSNIRFYVLIVYQVKLTVVCLFKCQFLLNDYGGDKLSFSVTQTVLHLHVCLFRHKFTTISTVFSRSNKRNIWTVNHRNKNNLGLIQVKTTINVLGFGIFYLILQSVFLSMCCTCIQ